MHGFILHVAAHNKAIKHDSKSATSLCVLLPLMDSVMQTFPGVSDVGAYIQSFVGRISYIGSVITVRS
jgi:hypothetical protein